MIDPLVYDIQLRLDPNSAKKVQDELNDVGSTANRLKNFDSEAQAAKKAESAIASKARATRQASKDAQMAGLAEENSIKSVTQEIRAQIDTIDLAQRQRRIDATEALRQYDALETKLGQLDQANQNVITRQRQLFFAQERARNGFVTMSTSLTDLQSNSKGATIALANIGRIAQDLPFGFIGISNNIDPLLVSFRELKKETGSTGMALRSIMRLLGGPLGLVFLLGSILPSAIVIAQSGIMGFGKKGKQAVDDLKKSVESLNSELAKGFAEAASSKGIEQLQDEFKAANVLLTQQEERLDAVNTAIRAYMFAGQRMTASDQNKLISLRAEKEAIEGNIDAYRAIEKEYRIEIATAEARAEVSKITSGTIIGSAQREAEAIKARSEASETAQKAELARLEALAQVERERLAMANAKATKSKSASEDALQALRAQQEIDKASKQAEDASRTERQETLLKAEAEFQARLRQLQIETVGETAPLLALEMQRQDALEQIRKDALLKGITSETEIRTMQGATSLDFEKRIADARTAILQKEMENRNQLYMMGADAAIQAGTAVFGETKALGIAQAIIDTWRGVQGVFADTKGSFPMRIAGSALAIATGLANVRKIMAVKKNTKSTGGGSTPSAPTTSPRQQETFGTTNSINMTPPKVTPVIVLQGDLDTELLAIKVRQGSDSLSSRGISIGN